MAVAAAFDRPWFLAYDVVVALGCLIAASAFGVMAANRSGRLRSAAHLVSVVAAVVVAVRGVTGLPVHRYLTQLRLARALVELPHADDLTALALSLGFSSHSQFSFAFRRAFGATPSRFREQAGRRPVPPLA